MDPGHLPRLIEDPNVVLRSGDTFKKLESSIFNSISLGQWELARASFRCLTLSGDANSQDTARELLKILILEAPTYWYAKPGELVLVIVLLCMFILGELISTLQLLGNTGHA